MGNGSRVEHVDRVEGEGNNSHVEHVDHVEGWPCRVCRRSGSLGS